MERNAFTKVQSLVDIFGQIVEALIPIAFGLAILAFFFGLAKYIFSAGDEDSKVDGKKIMIWGLVALFVMTSVFGIISLARNTLGTTDNQTIQPPRIELR